MKDVTCSFTGHRDIVCDPSELMKRLDEAVRNAVANGYTRFVAGGALGFDTMAARAVLSLREEDPRITLHLILPCKNQDKYWDDWQKKEYLSILEAADSHEYICELYTRYCMAKRNEAMVNASSLVIAYYNGEAKGGTAMTVRYAKKKDTQIINLF